ncbi:hypothetical protein O181_090344 [Austropuccinia psidii MF-1]|uniref:Uncharacterized protein n=1 Tax=Austropuccinia psidii MF-1 TaxID=1389203 RepID=A0A9Q3IVF1_9BASI|nr:hypothetical protein [Austropuccinia psidii MF-1]
MSLKAQTHFNTICNVWVITPDGTTQHILMRPNPPPDEPPTLPPISALTNPYAYAPPPHALLGLQYLHSCGALKLCPHASLHLPNPIRRLQSLP